MELKDNGAFSNDGFLPRHEFGPTRLSSNCVLSKSHHDTRPSWYGEVINVGKKIEFGANKVLLL
jgi:hypothetical protein